VITPSGVRCAAGGFHRQLVAADFADLHGGNVHEKFASLQRPLKIQNTTEKIYDFAAIDCGLRTSELNRTPRRIHSNRITNRTGT